MIPAPLRDPLLRLTAVALAVLGAAFSPGSTALAATHGGARAFVDFDTRRPAGPVVISAEKGLAGARLRERLRGVRAEVDAVTEAPQFVGSREGFLSGPAGAGRAVPKARAEAIAAGVPHRELKAFLEEYKGLYGHGAAVLAAAQVKRDYTNVHNGLRSVVWQQQVDGVPVFGAMLQSHVTKRGELVNVASHFLADPVAAATRGTPRRAALLAAPAIRATEAVAIAARSIGEAVQAADVAGEGAPQGAEKKQGFRAAALRGATAHFAWLPMDKGSARLCWEVVLTGKATAEMYRILVDATTGETHVRHCLTNYISEASYRVFTGDSPTPLQPGHATPSTAQPAEVSRTLVTLSALDPTASPNGWIDDGVNETRGNNVDAHLDLDANNVADTPRPQGSPSRVFDFPLDLTQTPDTYRNAAVTNLFFWCNWMHDKLYALGFNEAAGNFQLNNFGRGGAGNDAVQADAQDGGGTSNANFSTPPDGSPGRMQMYVFTGPTPDRDGAFDAAIILHEYAHGLSNRLVGGGVGLSAAASTGMGEGWSDFYGLALLSKAGDDPDGNYIIAGYSTPGFNGLTQNYYYGIRRYPYSTDLAKSPLTFKDIDPTQASLHAGVPRNPAIGNTPTAVHNIGEVWCVALWEARANLVAKHGFEIGNQLILQLVTDGMKLSPANPNFLQARDAILQADLVNNAGTNKDELWAAFAKRGMGASASAPVSTTTTGVVEAFDLPDDLTVTPITTFNSAGPSGGPFSVPSSNYTLRNDGAALLGWTANNTATWLSLSPASGTLAPGATVTVTASLNAAANALPNGTYNDSVAFTNTTSAHITSRSVTLFVGPPDYFTELFDTTTNDTAYQSFTFTPDGSASFYSVTREPVSAFPSDTSSGTTVTLSDDSSVPVALSGGARVKIYGLSYPLFFVGSNGYVTIGPLNGTADSSNAESFTAHFAKRRIAGLFRNLNPAAGGTVKRKQFTDRVAVTWQGVPEFGTTNSNNFQIEMFFADGRIRITILEIAATHGLIGLSQGTGIPGAFVESDFSTYPSPPTLTLTLPASAPENGSLVANQGGITLSQPAATDLTITLTSSDPTAVTVPASVIVPAGQTGVVFSPTILDDNVINGTRSVTITATAGGWIGGAQAISILDDENTTLALTLPNVTEGGTAAGTVSVPGTVMADLVVALSSGNLARLTVPPSVTIPAGSTSATFIQTAEENALTDGSATVTVAATAPGFTGDSGPVTVMDNDVHHFTFSTIGGTQLRGLPFGVAVTAEDVNGLPLPSFNGTATIDAGTTTDRSAPLNPATAVSFTAGVWSGNLSVGQVINTITLRAAGGATGESGVFNVLDPSGDLSGNGVPNLVKYAFNLDPVSPALTGLPVTTIEPDSADQARYLTLRYRRRLAPGPLQYVIQVSSDLLDWTTTAADFEELAPAVPNADGLTETVTVRIKPALGTPGAATRYARVRVLVP